MQTLGLSDSTPRTENRLKSLFWPSIQSGADVDYLGAQGYWVCVLLAVFSFVVSAGTGHPIVGLLLLLYYFLGGVGVRERSIYAAAAVLVLYVVDSLAGGLSIVRVLFLALLVSNLRAIWMTFRWQPESEEASLPPRLGETWTDKFADRLPLWLWPKVRILYYIFSAGMLLMVTVGMALIAAGSGSVR